MARRILLTPKGLMGGTDKFIWPMTKNGEYTVKSGNEIARKANQAINNNKASISTPTTNIWADIWSMKPTHQRKNKAIATWILPPRDRIKCNTDGAYCHGAELGAIAAVFRD
ncbi:hypothetical protein PIB30_071532 [Stylosanthes scabra]|uniref:RNase H type-1 domain-containing protein n=1 Tax=Stylosanthes scabra TaxID=79078 RepID=A0ABU6TQD7_9FABA|nr:hypothetical protein [Stylosanthes scabra]